VGLCDTVMKVHVAENRELLQVEVFWVVTPDSVVVGYQRFGGLYCSYLQGKLLDMLNNNCSRKTRHHGANWFVTYNVVRFMD
jgi:hypothetical protein